MKHFLIFIFCMQTLNFSSLFGAGKDTVFPAQTVLDLFYAHQEQTNRIWAASQSLCCAYHEVASKDAHLVDDVSEQKEKIYVELCDVLLNHDFPSNAHLESSVSASPKYDIHALKNAGSVIVSLVESSQDKYLRGLCVEKMLEHKRDDGSIDVRPQDFAQLYDRYMVDKGELQEYGTIHAIGLVQNGTYKPAPEVRDPEGLKERRLALGLDHYKPWCATPKFSIVFGNESFLVDPATLDKNRSSVSYIEEYKEAGAFIQGKNGVRPVSSFDSDKGLFLVRKEKEEDLFVFDRKKKHALKVPAGSLWHSRNEFLRLTNN